MRLLLVEDDDDLRTILKRGLGEAGYFVDAIANGSEAKDFLQTYEYAVAIIDWQLPGISGVELIEYMRKNAMRFPVLILTARDTPSDKIKGLDVGADDYLVKPFDYGELLARLRALQRRPDSDGSPILRVGDLSLDPSIYQISVEGQVIELTPREYSILEVLIGKYPSVVGRPVIALHAWNEEADAVGSNTIDVHIARLRAKLARSSSKIETVRSIGYKLVAEQR